MTSLLWTVGETSHVVDLPDDFVAQGYTGNFHVTAALAGTDQELADWAAKAPCLLPKEPGWMCAAVDQANRVLLLVRQDVYAVLDITTHQAGAPGRHDN